MIFRNFTAVVGLLVAAGAANAQQRPLDVGATSNWTHARTGIVLPAQLDRQIRRKIADYGEGEFDVIANYDDPADGTYTTVYLFHPGIASVPIWFDRVRIAAVSRPANGFPTGTPLPAAFALHPGGVKDGLRIAFALHDGANRSTAVAVAPIEDWLLVLRISSSTLDAAALDRRMSTVLTEIALPVPRKTPAAARAIEPCADQLKLDRARMLPVDMTQALMGSLAYGVAADGQQKGDGTSPVFCLDREDPSGDWALYRPDADRNSYVLAIADAGRAVEVKPSLAGLLEKGAKVKRYSVVFDDLERHLVYADVDRLPPPEQAIEITTNTTPTASIAVVDGKSKITINPAALPRK